MPQFSIIIANFNTGTKLQPTTNSVLSQNVDLELLIMDGASRDESLKLARDMAIEHDVLKIMSSPDRGVYDAMNKGIKLAKGRYLYFLGAGDVLEPGALKAIEPHLPAHNAGFVYGDVMFEGKRYDGPFDRDKLAQKNICHQSIFYGRNVFKLSGLYDLRHPVFADYAMNIKCFADDLIEKKYIDVVCATFESGGLSSQTGADGPMMGAVVARHFGWRWYLRHKRRISGSWTSTISEIASNRLGRFFKR